MHPSVTSLLLCCWRHLVNMIELSDSFQSRSWYPHQASWRCDLPFWHYS